jgi:hypothetical protein
MPDEETFESALDELMAEVRTPEGQIVAEVSVLNRLTEMRLVYADWLEERGDPRAALQRWLVRERKFPRFSGSTWDWWRYGDRPDCKPEDLPAAVWDRLPGKAQVSIRNCKEYLSRRWAERALFMSLTLLDLLRS